MAVYRLRWTRRALRRLDEIGTFIAADSPRAAEKIVRRLTSASRHLIQNPALGRTGRIPGTRELVLADVPYIIAYRVEGTDIELLTVMHAAQQWPDRL
ncbi:toxin Y4kP [Labrys miyagiensis]|uniref:Toxin Y4kP n=1 Tax=Labrys miyagiensis TaxID=346912 RepID=A0ABQ6C9V1_9HYPH|nr:type II toxin-antitoxin system RelE/ParE family toxin [Labrys miyagiensis]GLS17162.1 toxin Y4kP [Labrys miyagiensis]